MAITVTAGLCAPAAQAEFDQATLCTGPMRVYNEDGGFASYAMASSFDRATYRIRATNQDDGEAIDDRGQCGAYMGQGCRHMVSAPGDDPETWYEFTLSPRGGDRYLYSELWSDGFSGTALLTGTPQGGN